MEQINFGQVAKSYAKAREDIPASLMESLFIRGISFDGKKVADIGCGTGALTRKMSMRKADVIGLDPSNELLQQALTLNVSKSYKIPYVQGTAEDTGLQESQFDMVTVMRAWHWFDREQAIHEIKRILKPKGLLLVIDSGFLAGPLVVDKTFDVISKYVTGGLKPAGTKAESKQRINGFPTEWFGEWQKNGFELRDFYKLNYSVSYTTETWVEKVESLSWLAGLEEKARANALVELANSLPDTDQFVIPHDCNVSILRMLD
ncbi:class I SAM-dependent methyltransferase [Neobacillus niacini]|uniref:class I SAM-dependent methyltransferase n=1 Tax=Neobacillus niacini TaxID=86668 RepID=UPI002FFEA61E